MIGSLGPVVFTVSTRRIKTFSSFKRSGTARWATHEIMHQKLKREFLGPADEHITLTVRLDAAFGVNPTDELFVLRFLRDNGIAVPLILDGRTLTSNYFVIESMNEDWTNVDNRGRLLAASVELTLAEYALH